MYIGSGSTDSKRRGEISGKHHLLCGGSLWAIFGGLTEGNKGTLPLLK